MTYYCVVGVMLHRIGNFRDHFCRWQDNRLVLGFEWSIQFTNALEEKKMNGLRTVST